jgi:hypothetical protein
MLHGDRSFRTHRRDIVLQYGPPVFRTGTGDERMSGWNNSQSDDNDRFPPWNSASNGGWLRDCSPENQRRIMIITPCPFHEGTITPCTRGYKKDGKLEKNRGFFSTLKSFIANALPAIQGVGAPSNTFTVHLPTIYHRPVGTRDHDKEDRDCMRVLVQRLRPP